MSYMKKGARCQSLECQIDFSGHKVNSKQAWLIGFSDSAVEGEQLRNVLRGKNEMLPYKNS